MTKPLRLTSFALIGALCAAHAGSSAGGKILKLQLRESRDGAVMLTFVNQGSKPIRVWTDTCSWGYDALHLEATWPDGKTTRYRHVPVSWRKNYPQSWLIPAGGSHEIEAQLRSSEWQDFPTELKPAKVRFVFEVPISPEAHKESAWTGLVKSNSLTAPH